MRWCSSVLASIGDQCTMQQGLTFFEGGVFTDKTGLKIFVFINAMIFAFTTFVTNTPLYGKIASKVWKIYFQYISPHFLDAAGSQISDLWLLLLSNSSLFSALMSHLPLLLLHSAMSQYLLIMRTILHEWCTVSRTCEVLHHYEVGDEMWFERIPQHNTSRWPVKARWNFSNLVTGHVFGM